MFQGFDKDLISFFLKIRFNNNRDFMKAHQAEYRAAVRDPFYEWIEAVTPSLQAIDPDMEIRPSKCLSRIYRDTRFSEDKSPYRDHHWVAFRRVDEAKEGALFYWFEISVEHVSWGLGIWGENRLLMDGLRRRITSKPDELLSILPVLNEGRFIIGGNSFKRMAIPPELPLELVPWYTRRELYIEKTGTELSMIYSPDIVSKVSADFAVLKPFYRLLRNCAEITGNLEVGHE